MDFFFLNWLVFLYLWDAAEKYAYDGRDDASVALQPVGVNGETALHKAATLVDGEIACELLSHEAIAVARPFDWFTASSHAKELTPLEMVQRRFSIDCESDVTFDNPRKGASLPCSVKNVQKFVNDGLALAANYLRDAYSSISDDDEDDDDEDDDDEDGRIYADVAETAMSLLRKDDIEANGAWTASNNLIRERAMAYAMLTDPPVVAMIMDDWLDDATTIATLDQKLKVMREASDELAEVDDGILARLALQKKRFMKGVKTVASDIHQTALHLVPDANRSFLTTFHDPSYEALFRETFATESASPIIDAQMIVMISFLIVFSTFKVHKWSIAALTPRLIELVTPTGIFDGSLISKTLLGFMYPILIVYTLRTVFFHRRTWFNRRELVIMLIRPYHMWFLAHTCYSSEIYSACHKKHDLIAYFASALAPVVYRVRFERHVFLECLNIPGSVLMPAVFCGRSPFEMLTMLVIKVICSVPFSIYLFDHEKNLRRRFAAKFFNKVGKFE